MSIWLVRIFLNSFTMFSGNFLLRLVRRFGRPLYPSLLKCTCSRLNCSGESFPLVKSSKQVKGLNPIKDLAVFGDDSEHKDLLTCWQFQQSRVTSLFLYTFLGHFGRPFSVGVWCSRWTNGQVFHPKSELYCRIPVRFDPGHIVSKLLGLLYHCITAHFSFLYIGFCYPVLLKSERVGAEV